MPRDANLLVAKAPLYFRFLLLSAPVLGSVRLLGDKAAWACRLGLVTILLRRWLRCQRGLPSRDCCSCGDVQLEPTMDGLHRRFLELYGGPSAAVGASPEASALGMLRRLTLEDGQEIAFWDVGPSDSRHVVLLINGLGARIAGWTPLLDALHTEANTWHERRIVIPEYRGQFASTPLVGGRVSVEQSAADAAAVADALGISKCSLLCWSTGVQVGLELALLRPELVQAMVLIQGMSGRALRSIGQPPCTFPGVPALLAAGLRLAPKVLCGDRRRAIHGHMVAHTAAHERAASLVLWLFGSDLIIPTGVRYGQDMLHSDAHFATYCAYAEGLGRHEIIDRLPDIRAPALVVTGTPDFVTPARCSYDMAALFSGETELFDDIGGSHYYIFEEPHKLARKVNQFLERAAPVKVAS